MTVTLLQADARALPLAPQVICDICTRVLIDAEGRDVGAAEGFSELAFFRMPGRGRPRALPDFLATICWVCAFRLPERRRIAIWKTRDGYTHRRTGTYVGTFQFEVWDDELDDLDAES